MPINKRVLYILSSIMPAALLLAFFIPGVSRQVAAGVTLVMAFLVILLVKKRSILAVERGQATMIVGLYALMYVSLIYIVGLRFGFGYRSIYGLSATNLLNNVIPITVIIVTSEIIRRVLIAQEEKKAEILCYLGCVLADLLIFYGLSDITTFTRFIDAFAQALLPALIANVAYHKLSKRHGAMPNIVYRLITVLYLYLPQQQAIVPNTFLALFRIFSPLLLLLFISALYDKRFRRATEKRSKWTPIVSAVLLVFMISVVMLISCQFRYGAIIIATESMTGELDKGDAVVYEQYDDQIITEGQVIVFEKNGIRVVHRVTRIERINGQNRYYTKGDMNGDEDSGFITEANIIGIARGKVPFVGYPTIWLRKLIAKGVG